MKRFKQVLVLSFTLGLSFAYAQESYNFCGYKKVLVDPQKSEQFKELGIDDSYVVQPQAVRHKDAKQLLNTVILGSGKTLKKYEIKPYNLNVAKNNYVDIPAVGPFMVTWSDKYNKNIPAAWVYWLGDGKTITDGHYQPYNHVLEPINFIFIVKGFKDREQSNKYLVSQLEKAGFTKEHSDEHTSGYSGLFKQENGTIDAIKQIGGDIKGNYYGYTFEDTNDPNTGGDHFRVFGPYKAQKAYIYTASLSKESPRYTKNNNMCGHMFESFTKAKSILAIGLLDNTNVKIYATNLFMTIPNKVVNEKGNINTYFTGDQQVTNEQVSNVAFVAVFSK